MLLFPLDGAIHHKTDAQKSGILGELEMRSHAAGLAGSAAILWECGGRMHFMGPRPWRAFLQSISMLWVMRNLNREISW